MKTILKTIKDFPEYKISNVGYIVRNCKLRKLHINKDGYYTIDLWNKGKSKLLRVNRLVAQAFIPNPLNLPVVNHKDGNKLNNNVNNLEWCTIQQNTKHAFDNGLMKQPIMFSKDNAKSKKVYQYDLYGILIKKWDCTMDAKRKLKISHIPDCALGKRKTAGGFIWKYEVL